MKFIPAFLLASSVAYYCFILLPKPVMKNIDRRIERLIMFVLGTTILCFVALSKFAINTWWTTCLWAGLGIFYVFAAVLSYLGYSKWNVLWQEEKSNDIAQIAMWLWDLAIAICAFMKL